MIGEIYRKMLSSESVGIVSEFLYHESIFIENVLSSLKGDRTVVVVGCGEANYYDLTKKYGFNYIGIEPYLEKSFNPHVVKLSFESFMLERKHQKNQSYIFIFWFNVLNHINILPIRNKFFVGDVLVNSCWDSGGKARNIMKEYYSSFFTDSLQYQKIYSLAKKSQGLEKLKIPFSELKTKTNDLNRLEIAYV